MPLRQHDVRLLVHVQAVATLLLGQAASLVGGAQQLAHGLAVLVDFRDADAHAQFEAVFVPGEGEFAHGLAQLFADQARMLERTVGQQYAQFVATEARQDVAVAHLSLQHLGQQLQQHVAGGVAAGIVDDLELVQVEVQQRMRVAVFFGRMQGARHQVFEFAPVDQARQGVVCGLPRQLLAQLAFVADVSKHDDGAEDLTFARPDGCGGLFDGDAPAFARDQLRVRGDADGLAQAQALDGDVLERLVRVLIDQAQRFQDVEPLGQLAAPARELLGHAVQVARLALRIGGDDAVADGAERHFGQFLALGDHEFAQYVLGDIPDDAQGALGMAAAIHEDLRLGRQPVFAAIGPDDAVLQGVAAAPAHTVLQHADHLVAVIGMHAVEKGGEGMRQGVLPEAQQGRAPGRPDDRAVDDLASDDARIPYRHVRRLQRHL